MSTSPSSNPRSAAGLVARIVVRGTLLLVLIGLGWGTWQVARAVVKRPVTHVTDVEDGSQPAAPDAPAGLRRSGVASTGRFTTASLTIAPTHQRQRVRHYVVRVEQGLGIDANRAARQIQSVLDDQRGWVGTHKPPTTGNSFALVADPTRADFTISIASPGTVDAQCPLDTEGIWSCDDGHHILLNSDRWLYRTPIYTDTATYRAYMINHEVGHYLGLGHSSCSGPGRLAPVMMQQSKGLDGCRPNAWPAQTT